MPKSQETDYDSHHFGDLKFLNSDEFNLPLRDRLYRSARSHLCPIPDIVVKHYAEKFSKKNPEITGDQEKIEGGMKMAIERYNRCNFASREILIYVEENNPELFCNLMTPNLRVAGENPDQELNPDYLPYDFKDKMNFASTPYGYALPRIFLEEAGENQQNYLKALNLVEKLSQDEKIYDPAVFTVKLANIFCQNDADPQRVIYHLLSLDLLTEEGCKTEYQKIFEVMKTNTKTLYKNYQELLKQKGEGGLYQMGIIAPSDLK